MTFARPPLADAPAMAVYGDALVAAGDPLGTLVQLQLALEARPGDAGLVAAEAHHLAAHSRDLLGPAALHTSLCWLRWRRGFVVEATIRSVWDGELDPSVGTPRRPRLVKATRALLQAPVCVGLEALRLELPSSTRAAALLTAAAWEVRHGAPRSLRRLHVGTLGRDEDEWGVPTGAWFDDPPPLPSFRASLATDWVLEVSVGAGLSQALGRVFAR